MLISMTRFGFIFLMVLCLLTSLVKSTLTKSSQEQKDHNEILSPSISSSSLSKSPSSSFMTSLSFPMESFQSSSTSKASSTQTKSEMEPSSLTSTDSQSMDKDSEDKFLPPTPSTTEQFLSSSSHLSTSSNSFSTSSSLHSILTSSLIPAEDTQQDDDDLEDDTELIRTESIQEARLAKKKQRATPHPSKEEKKAAFENGLAHPQENTHIKNQPVIQGPSDHETTNNNNSRNEMNSTIIEDDFQSSRAENNSEDQDAPGLGKVGTALLSVGGVLMVAGITGGIFVWRAQQQQQSLPQHKSPTPSILMSSPGHHHHYPTALNLLDDSSNSGGKGQTPPPTPLNKAPLTQTMFDINHQGPPSASTGFASFERHDLMNNWQNGLDFNYSMEKLFNNHTRSPNHPSVKNNRASPAQGRVNETQTTSPSVSTAHHPFSSSSSTQLHNTTHNISTGEPSNHDKYETNDVDDHSHEDYAQGLHAASPISIYFPSSSPPPSSPPLLQQECKVKINLVHKDT